MTCELSTLCDPFLQDGLFGSGEWFAEFRRRHADIIIAAVNSQQQFTVLRLSGHNGDLSGFQSAGGRCGIIEPQSAFALAVIGPVTGEAAVGENWPDIPVEVHGSICPGLRGLREQCSSIKKQAEGREQAGCFHAAPGGMTERQLRVMAEVAGEQDRLREYIAECRGIHLEFE
ncbi:MAG TPA: hypothetical protein DC058_03995 [Planctomycetaceae bacterium]|nr:hypothetical protein [Planctomycetaceae bacterium]